MANTRTVLKFRRHREGRTNYHKRLEMLKSRRVRLVARVSNRHIVVQFIEYVPQGDHVLFGCSSAKLVRLGWKGAGGNIPAAYLTGLLAACLVRKNLSTKEPLILDAGQARLGKGNKVYAVVKGIIDGGLAIAHSPDNFPDEKRLTGQHIQKYAEQLKKNNPEKYKTLFSEYLTNACAPETIATHVAEIKKKILADAKN